MHLFLDINAHTQPWNSSQLYDGGRFPVEVEVEVEASKEENLLYIPKIRHISVNIMR